MKKDNSKYDYKILDYGLGRTYIADLLLSDIKITLPEDNLKVKYKKYIENIPKYVENITAK